MRINRLEKIWEKLYDKAADIVKRNVANMLLDFVIIVSKL